MFPKKLFQWESQFVIENKLQAEPLFDYAESYVLHVAFSHQLFRYAQHPLQFYLSYSSP